MIIFRFKGLKSFLLPIVLVISPKIAFIIKTQKLRISSLGRQT